MSGPQRHSRLASRWSLSCRATALVLAWASPASEAQVTGQTIRGGVLHTTSRSTTPVPVNLKPAQAAPVQSLVADITHVTMSIEMVNAVNGSLAGTYGNRWKLFVESNGLDYDRLGRGSLVSRDRGSLRPFMLSPEEEIAVRTQMAHVVKDYAVDPGLRKLLASREATKELMQTVTAVETATKVELRSETNWAFSAGMNPFTLGSFVTLSHPAWTFEARTDFDAPLAFQLVGVRRWTRYSFTNVYTHADGAYRPVVGYAFNPRLSTSFGGRYFLRNEHIWNSSYHDVGLSYSF